MKIKNVTDKPTLTDLNDHLKGISLINENLSIINNNLHQVSRNLKYWDIYKLNKQIVNKNTLPSILSSLTPSESCVINFEGSETYAGITYRRGDVVYRTTSGNLGLIPSLSNGIYIPDSFILDNNNTILKYKFTQEVSSEGQQLSLTLPNYNVSASIYGIVFDNPSGSKTFTAEIYNDGTNNHTIKPVIRFFNENYEIITADFSLTLANNVFTIANYPSIVKHIQVK